MTNAQMNAEVYNGDHLLGTGTAYEKESSSYINKTSYIENCETSAVGRALGMCGFGIDTSVASKEEVENAIAQQDAMKADEAKREETKRLEDAGIPLDYVCSLYKVERIEDMTEQMHANLHEHFNDVVKMFNEAQ